MSTTKQSKRPQADRRAPMFQVGVIDDEPTLARSIRHYMEVAGGIVPKFEYLTKASSVDEIDKFVRAADALLLDHRIGTRFAPFRNGLEIGKRILEVRRDGIPIHYYSAYNDLLRGTADASRSEVQEFANRKNVTVYGKAELAPNRRLDELCASLRKHFEAQVKEAKAVIINDLQSADIVSRERKLFRIEHFDKRRKYQQVRNLQDPYAATIELPTSSLSDLGLEQDIADIVMEVCEFSSGHVISKLSAQPLKVSKDLHRLLRESELPE